jgi:hypothetical protein
VLLSRSTWLLLGALGSECRRMGPVAAKGFHRHIEAFAHVGPAAGGAPLALEADGVRVNIEPGTVNPATARALLARAAAALPDGEEASPDREEASVPPLPATGAACPRVAAPPERASS